MKIVNTAVGGGRRTHWDKDLMSAYYSPPGIIYEPADEHNEDTDHPMAACRQEVGGTLVERHDHVRRLEDVIGSTDTDTDTDVDAGEGEGGEEDDRDDVQEDAPLAETDPEQLTDVERDLDTAEYNQLKKIGGELDDVDGSQSEGALRSDLHTHPDEDAVREAIANVKEEN